MRVPVLQDEPAVFDAEVGFAYAKIRMATYTKRRVIRPRIEASSTRRVVGDRVVVTHWEAKYTEEAVVYVADSYAGAAPSDGCEFGAARLVSREIVKRESFRC